MSKKSPERQGRGDRSEDKDADKKARKAEKQRAELKAGLMAPDFKGLNTEYPSFELLWFDLSTKCRHLMEELITPLVDRLVEHKDHLNQNDNQLKRHHTKLEEFKEIIYKTDNKLDVFDEIHAAITKTNTERLILEDNMKFEVGNLRSRMDDIDERNEQTIKQFGNMQTHTKELIEELTDLKDTYKKQSEAFVGELRKLEERQIRDFDLVTRTTNGLTNLSNEHGVRLNLHDSQLSELFGRMKLAEKEIEKLRAVTTHLDTIKTNKVDFIKAKKKLELKNLQ